MAARPPAGNKPPHFIHPAFGKSVTGSFPTPLVEDVVLVIAKEVNAPGYQVADYGTSHPDSNRYPNHKLVLIQPSEDGLKAKWFYVADRDDQDTYNFALKYKLEKQSSAIYIRQYVLPRDGYTPLPKGTPDSIDQNTRLTHEEVLGAADGELAGLYVKVVRVFEELPGPAISGLENTIPRKTPTKFILDDSTEVTKQEVEAEALPDEITTEGSSCVLTAKDTIKSEKETRVVTTNYRTTPLPSFVQTPQGQIETIEEQIVDEGATLPAVTATTIESSSDALGNGKAIQKVGTVESVFGENTYAKERPDVTPVEFRALLPTSTTGDVEAGTAAPPTLGTGDLSASEEQTTVQKKRLRRTTRELPEVPAQLTESVRTPQGQVGEITKTLDDGVQTFTPTATTIDAKVTNLGDGRSVLEITEVDSVFGENVYETERPDVTPIEFRALLPATTTGDVEAGTAAPPVLNTGDLSASEEQITAQKIRLRRTNRDLPDNGAELVESVRTAQGQIGTVTKTLDAGVQTFIPTATTVEAKVTNLGDGRSVLEVTEVDSVFGENVFGKDVPDVVPERFRVAIPTKTTSVVEAGTAVEPTLGEGDLEVTEEQVTEQKKRTRTRTRSGVELPVQLISKDTDKDKQVVTITDNYREAGTDATPNATQSVTVQNLGDGRVIETVKSVPTVFSAGSYNKSIPDVVPVEMRAVVPTYISEETSAGTANTDPTLGTGDLSKTETQVDEFTKRVRTENRSIVGLPKTLTDQKTITEFGGTRVDETKTLDLITAGMTPDEGLMVVSSEVRNLGNGESLKVTVAASEDTSWPTLSGSKFDEETQSRITVEEQIVAAGYTPAPADFTVENVTPVDKWRSNRHKITKNPDAIDESTAIISEKWSPFQFPGLLSLAGAGYYVRRTRAELCRQTIKTWWVNSLTKPNISVNEIVMDNPIISSLNNVTVLEYAGECLHDDLLTFNTFYYPATTPTMTQYTGRIVGTGTMTMTADSPNIVGTGSLFTTELATGYYFQSLGNSLTISSITDNTHLTLSGDAPLTGTIAVVFANPNTAWIGNSKVVAANITPTDIPNLWKVQTINIVMR